MMTTNTVDAAASSSCDDSRSTGHQADRAKLGEQSDKKDGRAAPLPRDACRA